MPVRRLSPALLAAGTVAALLTGTAGGYVASVAAAPAAPVAPSSGLTSEGARLLGALDAMPTGTTELTAPDDWSAAQHTGISQATVNGALSETRALRAAAAASGDPLATAPWTAMGPTNVGGRVADLVADPLHRGVVYSATASGGVWKSTDFGITFTPSWPLDIPGAMGALAAGSDGALWAGTGEANPGGGSTTFPGTGLYRSTDQGATWQSAGLRGSGTFGRIAVDPTDPKRAYAAATGPLFTPGGERGVYRTTDAGATWTLVLPGANATTGAVDVAIDPANPKVLLAGMWDRLRTADARYYSGVGSGLYRSTDGGDTWTRAATVTADLPADTGRIGVAFAPSNPNRAYATVANKADGSYVGLWRSDDAGLTWTKLPTDATLNSGSGSSSYGWWFGRIFVDPLDAQRLFVMGLEILESIDGGASFNAGSVGTVGVLTGASIVSVHSDQHAMAFDPQTPGLAYLGNDGGVYRSTASGRPGTWVGAMFQGATQHFTVDTSATRPDRVVAGLQDNMCQRNYVEGSGGRPETWTKYGLCGDGLQTLVDPQDDTTIYGCAQYGGNCTRATAGAVPNSLGSFKSGRKGWLTPIVFEPGNSSTLYFGGNLLERSTDQGATWKAISPDLTGNPKQNDPNSGYRIYGTITTIGVGTTDKSRLYFGTDTGRVYTSPNGGGSWTRIDTGLPRVWVTRLVVDPTNAATVYLTLSGYRNGESAPHVFRSTDAGASWTDISGNLPDAPVNDLVQADGRLLVGTDTGVFATSDGGASWTAVGSGLPTGPVMDLSWNAPSRSLTAATFGAGIRRVVLPAPGAAPAAPAAVGSVLRGAATLQR